MIAIFAAMEAEVNACLPAVGSPYQRDDGRFPLVISDGVVVCQTGLGRVSRDAAEMLLSETRPRAVLSVGTAGGLEAGLSVGDIILCRLVTHSEEPGLVQSDRWLLEAALEAGRDLGLAVQLGTSVTVDVVAWGSEEKAALYASGGPDIVEMESFWIGQAANEHGIPYLAIRAVSDDANNQIFEIPDLFDDHGRVDSSRLLAFTREHPEAIPELAAQHARGGIALASLGGFLHEYLPRLREPVP